MLLPHLCLNTEVHRLWAICVSFDEPIKRSRFDFPPAPHVDDNGVIRIEREAALELAQRIMVEAKMYRVEDGFFVFYGDEAGKGLRRRIWISYDDSNRSISKLGI